MATCATSNKIFSRLAGTSKTLHLYSKIKLGSKANDVFAEWAKVHGNCYGTARAPVQRALADGLHNLLDIDFQGVAQPRAAGVDDVYIFILPPSMAEFRTRFQARNTESVKATRLLPQLPHEFNLK